MLKVESWKWKLEVGQSVREQGTRWWPVYIANLGGSICGCDCRVRGLFDAAVT